MQETNKEVYGLNLNDIPRATLQGHMWRQEGAQLICQSCSFKHATFIEPGYQLYGIDNDGRPMIRKLTADRRSEQSSSSESSAGLPGDDTSQTRSLNKKG